MEYTKLLIYLEDETIVDDAEAYLNTVFANEEWYFDGQELDFANGCPGTTIHVYLVGDE